MKIIYADELIALLEEQRRHCVGYENWTIARIIKLIDDLPGINIDSLIEEKSLEIINTVINKLP